jgi:hypothetical protein
MSSWRGPATTRRGDVREGRHHLIFMSSQYHIAFVLQALLPTEKKEDMCFTEGRHKAKQEYMRVSPEVNANIGNISLFDIVAFHTLFLQTRAGKEISSTTTMKAENEARLNIE